MFKIINIDKPQGWTSNDVVQKIKHSLNLKKEKVGHLGTLDPFATGVLPITIGKATRLFDFYLGKKKEYIASIEFGVETDSLDIEGEIIKHEESNVSAEQIKLALMQMVGKASQIPPIFSAKKINGKKAYELARSGKEVALSPKEVEFFELELIEKNANIHNNYSKISEKYQKTLNFNQIFEIRIVCSSGTYIRSFGRDLAQKLGTCANVVALRRTSAGEFKLNESVPLDVFLNEKEKHFLKFENVMQSVPRFEINETELSNFLSGKKIFLNKDAKQGEKFFILHKGKLVALCHNEKIDDKEKSLTKTCAFLYDAEENSVK